MKGIDVTPEENNLDTESRYNHMMKDKLETEENNLKHFCFNLYKHFQKKTKELDNLEMYSWTMISFQNSQA